MTSRQFHPADIYSVTSGILLSPLGIQGVVDFLSHLTGKHLHNDQIENALNLTAPLLRGAYPEIAQESLAGGRPSEKLAFREHLEEHHGAAIEVRPISDWPCVEFPHDDIEDRFADVRKDKDDPRATARDNALAKARRKAIESGLNGGRRTRDAREQTLDLFRSADGRS